MTLRGRGQAYDDPAALLRGDAGRPVDVEMDLTWTTAGTPYQYRLSTRYEIPCTVSGTVTADGRSYSFTGVAGQRDHSWAARDWWSMDWVWSALHLDDGTHLHGVDLQDPRCAGDGRGYAQRAGDARRVAGGGRQGDVRRRRAAARHDAGAGARRHRRDHRRRGHAPVLLRSSDGRVSRFPRAWVTVTTGDGRTGVGWVEWNRNLT